MFHCNSVVRSCNENLHDIVVNLSSYTLSNAQLNILSKGLSFVPYAQFPTQCKTDEISDFIRKLRLRYIYRATQTKPNPFRLKSKQNTKSTNCLELERLIDRIQLTLSQIHPAVANPISRRITPPQHLGGLGIPNAEDECHINQVAQAFKFISDTRDPTVQNVALDQLSATIHKRSGTKGTISPAEMSAFLNTPPPHLVKARVVILLVYGVLFEGAYLSRVPF